MKLRHLLLVSAVSVGFGSAAMAAQDQNSQSGTSASPSTGQQNMQGMEHDPQMVRQLQQKLKQEGFNVGEVDGRWGPQTQGALRQWQQKQGMTASGELDQQSLAGLGLQGADMSTGTNAQNATAGRESMSGTSPSPTGAGANPGTPGNTATTPGTQNTMPGSTTPGAGAATGAGGNAGAAGGAAR